VNHTPSEDVILLTHGSGGTLSHELVAKRLLSHIGNKTLGRLDDSALVEISGRVAFTTDSYIVDPIFFPGGDIGRLAVCGTVNDLSVVGATPICISLALIIEEGFPTSHLDMVMASVRATCDEAGVQVVTGDTKVVNRGKADKLFINTSGIGTVPEGIDISGHNARPGDRVLLSGTIADHGVAIMGCREGLSFSSEIESDCAPLNGLVAAMLREGGEAIHAMRDPTRGGLASTLNEIASQSDTAIHIEESRVPVNASVRAACEMLGLDPLYVANEGKLAAIVAPEVAPAVLAAMQGHSLGRSAVDIGEVIDGKPGRVTMRTLMGPARLVPMLAGELLPRIC
jgi:hydrogenase expression/formation protein HypE